MYFHGAFDAVFGDLTIMTATASMTTTSAQKSKRSTTKGEYCARYLSRPVRPSVQPFVRSLCKPFCWRIACRCVYMAQRILAARWPSHWQQCDKFSTRHRNPFPYSKQEINAFDWRAYALHFKLCLFCSHDDHQSADLHLHRARTHPHHRASRAFFSFTFGYR